MPSTVNDDSYDPSFSALPLQLRQRIDFAFDAAISTDPDTPSRERKRQKLGHDSSAEPGGFVIDDAQPGGFIVDQPQPGGFLVDDEPSPPNDESRDDGPPSQVERAGIPLSLIPTALQTLDLQPDDEDVLLVFRNAASGWAGGRQSTAQNIPHDTAEQVVSRKDWRAVCAALLDPGDAGTEEEGAGDNDDEELGSKTADHAEFDEDDSGSGDDFMDSGAESDTGDDDDDDDEYHDGGFVTAKSKSKKTRLQRKQTARKTTEAGLTSDSEDADGLRSRRITPRQKQECRRAFSLFFPEVSDEDLGKQKIKISDIAHVAKLLKEKIKAEEIIEMLEAFSTSPDKSMSLADFERMMITAKLA